MRYLLIAFMFFYSISLFSSEVDKDDTLKVYRLGEVEVLDRRDIIPSIKRASTNEISYHIVQNSDVSSAAQLQLYLPSGYVRTNSRGESMLFVRGAGERQLGLFFDGVAMNIPWDNRLDLTFVPTDIIGNIRVNKSGSSIFYGPNVLGGAVSITTIERANPGYGLNVKLQAGDGNTQSYSILHDGRIDNFNYITNLSYYKTDGSILSAKAPDNLGNQSANSALRSNTASSRINFYGRGEYRFNPESVLGLSFSYTTQEKGVAPETFAGTDARFWKYPERNRMIITLNGMHEINDDFSLKATVWNDIFSQKIEDYKSIEYNEINEIQDDDDNTLGARFSLNYFLSDNQNVSLVINGFTTAHKQSTDGNNETEFSQITVSPGLEYTATFNDFETAAGIGIDYNQTPKTGLFTEEEGASKSDFAGFLMLKYNFSQKFAALGNLSRRTRFPTMREQYDGALGKFKTNPDLKPETGLLSEIGLLYEEEKFNVKISGFYNSYSDLIERIRLSEDQDPQKRRMRVNYAEATVSGIDAKISYSPINNLNIDAFYTYLNTEAKQDGKEIEHLFQKPEMLGGMMAYYRFDFGLKPQIELEYTGKQYDSEPDNPDGFVEIDPSPIMNIRLAYEFILSDALVEFYIRLNNVTDEYKLSQYGLPAPGRTFFIGLQTRI